MTGAYPRLRGQTGGPRPVFVIGLPRSGTTLCERVLPAAEGVYPGGDLAARPDPALWPDPDLGSRPGPAGPNQSFTVISR